MSNKLELRLYYREVKTEGRSNFLPVVICEAWRKRIHLDLLKARDEKHLGDGVRIEVEHRCYRRPSKLRAGEFDRIEAYHLSLSYGEFHSRKGERIGSSAILYRIVGQSNWMSGKCVDSNWRQRDKVLPYRFARRRAVRAKRVVPIEKF